MRRLEWLEAMRGLAALWVVTHHASQAAHNFLGTKSVPVFVNGVLGVDFFFVLSGFIIAISSQALRESGRGLRDYVTARAIRIYVPYLPIGVAMVGLYILLPGLSQGTRTPGLLTSVSLLPSTAPPALSVAWTLVHEILFYALFALFFVSRRLLVIVLAAWVGVILYVWAAQIQLTILSSYFLAPLNLCFVIGVVLAYVTRNGVSNHLACILAVAGVMLVGWQAIKVQPDHITVVTGFACLVCSSRAEWAMNVSPGRVLLLFGAASYAVYLVHNPVQSAVVRAVEGIDPTFGFWVLVSAGAGAGVAYHLLYEQHALRYARRLAAKRVAAVAPAATL